MSFDPPPTDNHAANKPRPSIHLSRSFSSTRSTPILEPPAYSAEDVLANKYRKVSKLVSSLRTAVTAITLAVSITVIACAASSLRSYGGTKSTGDWWLPLWPSSVDLRPTHVVLSCGVIITIFSLAYLALALFPSPRSKLHLLNITSTVLSGLGLFVTLFASIFAATINSRLSDNTTAGSLQSWTCKWTGFQSVAPGKFATICMESMVSLNLVILLVVLEVLAIANAGWGWWVEMKMKRGSVGGELKLENASP